VALRRGRLEEAEGYFEQALAIRREVQDRRGEGIDLANLGLLAEKREQWDEAEAWYRQGLAGVRETQDAASEASIALSLGEVLIRHLEQQQEGCQLVGEAIAVYEQMGLVEQAMDARATAKRLGCAE
jgi:tetratricopeptide (TPR) repeat protein